MSLSGRNWSRAAADPAAGNSVRRKTSVRLRGSRLFAKYVALFVAVVIVALLFSGVFDALFYYREHRDALVRIQNKSYVLPAIQREFVWKPEQIERLFDSLANQSINWSPIT